MPSDLDRVYQEAIFSLECPEGCSFDNLFFKSIGEDHSSCFMHLDLPQTTVPKAGNVKMSPTLFEVVGQIAVEDCYLTKCGDECLFPEDEKSPTVYSCWIEARPDQVSCIHWRNVVRGLDTIIAAIPVPIDTIHAMRTDPETDSVKIQVGWRPPAGQSIEDTFPLYDNLGERCIPSCDAEVPFGKPAAITQLKNALQPSEKKKNFEKNWKTEVETRWKKWKRARPSQSQYTEQLEWEAHVVEYVNTVYKLTKAHGNSKTATNVSLRHEIPLYGPHFIPPTYADEFKQDATPGIVPETAYLKPLTVIHPFYFPELARCPQCSSDDIKWCGWTPTGHREVHGIFREETALGFQLRCQSCAKQCGVHGEGDDEGPYCFSTTSPLFWEKREHWEIPAGIPICLRRCAITRDLFDLVVELRPSTTAAGLAENIKQLHLLEYHKQRLSYLQSFKMRQEIKQSLVPAELLRSFSKPNSAGGYSDQSITDDLVTDVYNKFSEKTRQTESEYYLRTLSATCVSLDNTFRTASKAKVTDGKKNKTKSFKGGILTVMNERNEIISWRFCQTQQGLEIEEVLGGLKERLGLLGDPDPSMAVVDNCCHVVKFIKRPFPDIHVVLDVWHFVKRYLICILNGTKNPLYSAIASDIVDAVLKTRADKHNLAVYWSQLEQEKRLVDAYEKWFKRGGVWSVAAQKAHEEQLGHVQKGCLSRTRQDVPSDGSRIEGSHKGWNGLQRSHASGIEVLSALCHDFVLRRNIRIGSVLEQCSTFLTSTHGSHHIRLVDAVAKLWNALLQVPDNCSKGLRILPELEVISSNEKFGLVSAKCLANYQNLVVIKDEPRDDLLDLALSQDHEEVQDMLRDLDIDPALLLKPAFSSSSSGRPSLALDLPRSGAVLQPTTLTLTAASLDDAPDSGSSSGVMTARVSAGTATPNTSAVIVANSTVEDDIVVMGSSEKILQPATSSPSLAASQSLSHIVRPALTTPSRTPNECRTLSIVPSKRKADDGCDIGKDLGTHILSGSSGLRERSTLDVGTSSKRAKTAGSATRSLSRVDGVPNVEPVKDIAMVSSAGDTNRVPDMVSPREPAAPRRTESNLVGYFNTARNATSAKIQDVMPLPSVLPLPNISGLTPSQRLFSLAMGMHIQSMSINTKDEFFLFMDMRAEKRWASFSMTPRKWVIAASEYNTQLEAFNRSRGQAHLTVRKTPRALMEKLGELEPKIIARIVTGHYTSRQLNTEDFWKKHCSAVPGLVKSGKGGDKTPRKTHTCSRCKTIMWPGPEGAGNNHKKSYCSDGVMQKPKTLQRMINGSLQDVTEHPPDWPQPRGIFTGGTHFNPAAFLAAVRDMYDCVVVKSGTGGDHAMEYSAFAGLLSKRTVITDDGAVLFELYGSLEVTSEREHADIIVQRNGIKYLRVNCLHSAPVTGSHDDGEGSSELAAATVL
ncbi:hypothetical protein SCP_0311740 [Sparassis crispa]|uniref:Uncharacterized protein n=1 Tax=Sparassis crispa TaxID=139825 RepID=A0A401GH41_9APHY|nr:hypothetical protein SCP_0311740 [Sparassis crispa]GBE81445.1 hypothetical protein SCP_0311740 [Sparassis crispa]